MTAAQNWKSYLTEWPADFPRSGVLVSTLNEVMPFRRFWLKGEMLLMERTAPDANGARFVLMGLDGIYSLKFINPITDASIAAAGFDTVGAEKQLQPN